MKTRYGFVSNSSTTSFCIYGCEIDREKLKKALKDGSRNLAENVDNDEDEDDYFEENAYEFGEKIGEEFKIEVHYGQNSELFIGRSYSTIKGNETGNMFKDYVKTQIQEVFKKYGIKQSCKCDTIEEAYRDG